MIRTKGRKGGSPSCGLLRERVAFSLQRLHASVQRGLGLEVFAVHSAPVVASGQIVLAVQGYDIESLHSRFTFLSFFPSFDIVIIT